MKVLLGVGVRDEMLTRPNHCLLPMEESFAAGSQHGRKLADPTHTLCNCVRMDALNLLPTSKEIHYWYHLSASLGPWVFPHELG